MEVTVRWWPLASENNSLGMFTSWVHHWIMTHAYLYAEFDSLDLLAILQSPKMYAYDVSNFYCHCYKAILAVQHRAMLHMGSLESNQKTCLRTLTLLSWFPNFPHALWISNAHEVWIKLLNYMYSLVQNMYYIACKRIPVFVRKFNLSLHWPGTHTPLQIFGPFPGVFPPQAFACLSTELSFAPHVWKGNDKSAFCSFEKLKNNRMTCKFA